MSYDQFRSKTMILTISIPYELLDEIVEVMAIFHIDSRSKAISYMIRQGTIRLKEQYYELYNKLDPRKYPMFEEEEEKEEEL